MFPFFKKKHRKISFEDIQYSINHPAQNIIINTMPFGEQTCLIKNTILCENEETVINKLLNEYNFKTYKFIIYGKNAADETVDKKADQLGQLGFSEIYIYAGGLFEWMLLQDIYGEKEFPTTKKVVDLLRYKPPRTFGVKLLLG